MGMHKWPSTPVWHHTDAHLELYTSDVRSHHFVSDDKHDCHAVHRFNCIMMQHLEEQQAIPVQKVMYFSDGAPAQYKNKTAFADLLCAEDFGVAAERHFFGTRHGNIWCNHCVHKTSQVPTLQQYQSYSCFCIIRVMIHCCFLSLCRQLQHIICSHWWKMAHPLKMPWHERRMERKYIPRTRHKSQQWLAILTSSKMMHEEMELVEEKTNRIPTIKLKISNAVHTYINCYAPNVTTDIVNFLQQLQCRPHIH